jgi:hypothetical protein
MAEQVISHRIMSTTLEIVRGGTAERNLYGQACGLVWWCCEAMSSFKKRLTVEELPAMLATVDRLCSTILVSKAKDEAAKGRLTSLLGLLDDMCDGRLVLSVIPA